MLALILALCQPADPAAEALKPLTALAGKYDLLTTEFDGRTGQPRPPVKGTERIFSRAGGQIVLCDRQADNGYDDLMVYQYDSVSKQVKGFLFMPLPEAKPRQIAVTFNGPAVVLTYEPMTQGGKTIRTRETITPKAGGGYTRLVEWQMPDGSFTKRREIVGTPAKGGN